jgi:16S rRNA (guanine527-N7)-methyltransferase
MKDVSNQQLTEILCEYHVSTDAGSALIAGIQSYIGLLGRWNRSISLTTVTDPEETARFHFGESLFAASLIPITNGRLADVGSGAGFPGLPLKMLAPALGLLLIESNTKKAAFLSEVVRQLALDRVTVSRGRMEELESEPGSGFDFITARALGHFGSLLTWAKNHLSVVGKVVLWLGEEDVDVVTRREGWKWSSPAKIPCSKRRFIVSGSSQD